MRPRIYAHRGASALYAEHTRAAYLQALRDGADGVECDVQLTKDNEVVLLHDATVDRTSSGSGDVGAMTLRELRELDFSSWKGADFPDEFGGVSQQFLTLAELLEILLAAGRPIGFAIEFKHAGGFGRELEERTLDLLTRHGWNAGTGRLGSIDISFMSFDPDSLEFLLHRMDPGKLCQLVDDVSADALRRELGLGRIAGAAIAALVERSLDRGERMLDDGDVGMAGPGIDYLRAHPERVAAWLSSGRRLRVWTVDEPADVVLCAGLGIQEITCNNPAAVRAVLQTVDDPAANAQAEIRTG